MMQHAKISTAKATEQGITASMTRLFLFEPVVNSVKSIISKIDVQDKDGLIETYEVIRQ